MKNLAKQVGKAILYFLIYFLWQMIWSFELVMVHSVLLGVQLGLEGGSAPTNLEAQEMLQNNLTTITHWAMIFSAIMTILTIWGIFVVSKKRTKEELSMKKIPSKMLSGVALCAVGLYLLIAFGLELIPFPKELWESYAEASETLAETSVLMIISTVLIAPILEEIIFRAMIFGNLKKAMPVWLATIISSIVFAVMHGQLLWMTYTFVLGVVCCINLHKTKSIYSNIFIHMFFNIFGGALNFLFQGIPGIAYPFLALAGFVVLILGIGFLYRDSIEHSANKQLQSV